jgi:glutamate--cysteine ligase
VARLEWFAPAKAPSKDDPQLTASSGPLADLERRILDGTAAVEHWFRGQWQEHTPPFYSSVDLRNSGCKLAPVDTNLFPGGFNNLNPSFLPLAVQAVMVAIERHCPDAANLLLVPENHTRNTFYLRNVSHLRTILRQAGLNVRIGTLIPRSKRPPSSRCPTRCRSCSNRWCDAAGGWDWPTSIRARSCSTTISRRVCQRP